MDSGTYHLAQPQIINQIVSYLILSNSDATPRTTPDFTTNIMVKCQDAEKFDQHFHYRGVIGKCSYLEQITQPDIVYAVHQCMLLSEYPRKPHGEDFNRIGFYLKVTDKMGIYIRPRDIDVMFWADADVSCN